MGRYSRERVEQRDITRHVIIRIGGHDLPIAIASTFVWSWVLGACDWRVLAVLTSLRAAAWIAHARALLEPVRAWQALAPEKVSDQTLLDVDARLERFSFEFLRVYIVGWVVSIGLAVALGSMDVPAPVGSGSAERLIALLLLPVLAVGEISSTKPVIKGALLEIQTRAAAMLFSRRIPTAKPPRSLAQDVVVTFLGITLGLSTLVVGVAGLVRVRDVREHVALEQLARAEMTALHLSHGEIDELDSDFEIIETDDLPPELAADDDADAPRRAIVPAQQLVLAAAPVGDGRWVLTEARPDEQLPLLFGFWLGFLALVGVPLAIVSRALVQSLIEPLTTLDQSTRQVIDEGQIRTLGRVVTLQEDEVGRLAANFNRMLDQLGEIATAASAVADGNLDVELAHPGELPDAFRGMLARLRELVGQIRSTALELASTTAEIHAATREQERGAEQQSANMQEVSATVDSLAATAAEITTSAEIVLDNAARAAATTQHMAARIAELDTQTRGIAELLELIREIADRSDLLALNGALEAVRAGETGRGFALVAAEMRRLAERVNDAVARVHERVEDIQRATQLTIESTEQSHALVQSTAAAAKAISEVTHRQNQETRHASSVVRDAAAAVHASAAATTQMRASAEALRLQADELEGLVRRFAS
jgi:methyl-accepting chemotaxis protein